MTNAEKSCVSEMRKQGCTYASIAEKLHVSEGTIKTYCRRTKISDTTQECKQCGRPIEVIGKCKPRRFCSDKCRTAWWYANRGNEVRTEYHLTCACCGRPFVGRGNKARKYCSHECYIVARFGGDRRV